MSNANALTLSQVTQRIAKVGHLRTILVRGQPGVGKSTILKSLANQFPDYQPVYIDVANLDLGSLALPMFTDRGTSTFAPNERYGIVRGSSRPLIVMLDEITKASSTAVLNMLLPVMLERRFEDIPLPAGSIVFGTGNLLSDGVGDKFPAHACNRVTEIDMTNPTAEEWLAWAQDNDIHPVVQLFAKKFPQVFDRYDLTEDTDNPYIFDPRKGQVRQFVTPRSLHAASDILWSFEGDTTPMLEMIDEITSTLAGTFGAAAAHSVRGLVLMGDRIPDLKDVVKNPNGAALPADGAVAYMAALRYASSVKPAQIEALMMYLKRWEAEHDECLTLAITRLAARRELGEHLTKTAEFSGMTARLMRVMR